MLVWLILISKQHVMRKKSYSIVSNTKYGLNIICGIPEIVLRVHVNSWIMHASLLA